MRLLICSFQVAALFLREWTSDLAVGCCPMPISSVRIITRGISLSRTCVSMRADPRMPMVKMCTGSACVGLTTPSNTAPSPSAPRPAEIRQSSSCRTSVKGESMCRGTTRFVIVISAPGMPWPRSPAATRITALSQSASASVMSRLLICASLWRRMFSTTRSGERMAPSLGSQKSFQTNRRAIPFGTLPFSKPKVVSACEQVRTARSKGILFLVRETTLAMPSSWEPQARAKAVFESSGRTILFETIMSRMSLAPTLERHSA